MKKSALDCGPIPPSPESRHTRRRPLGSIRMRLALFQPDIPQNLGAAIRLTPVWGSKCDVEPCAFPLSDRSLRRTALDSVGDNVALTRRLVGLPRGRGAAPGALCRFSPRAAPAISPISPFSRATPCCLARRAPGLPTMFTPPPTRGCWCRSPGPRAHQPDAPPCAIGLVAKKSAATNRRLSTGFKRASSGAMTDTTSLVEDRRNRARVWFETLRDRIMAELERIEDEAPAALYPGDSGRFERRPWTRETGSGGGVGGFLSGRFFEKAGVHTSSANGRFAERGRDHARRRQGPELRLQQHQPDHPSQVAARAGGAYEHPLFVDGGELVRRRRRPDAPAG